MTYSIVARDPESGALGVAVQTAVMGVGAICAWAEGGVGAVATQASSDPGYGPRLLDRLYHGEPPALALAELAARDERAAIRQVAVVDAQGATAAFTGASCIACAGDAQADGLSAQANMMAAPGVPEAMRAGYAGASGPFARRLLAALDAAQAHGGDFRGMQSAALLIVDGTRREGAERRLGTLLELRVEDHPRPLAELRRLLDVADAYELSEKAGAAREAGDAATARALHERAVALAAHDQNILFADAVDQLQGGDPAALRALIAARPGMRTFVDWCAEHGEASVSPELLALL